jgi:hypothetical protein
MNSFLRGIKDNIGKSPRIPYKKKTAKIKFNNLLNFNIIILILVVCSIYID